LLERYATPNLPENIIQRDPFSSNSFISHDSTAPRLAETECDDLFISTVSAAPAAGGAAPAAGGAAPAAAAKKAPEPEPEEDADMGFSLFD